MLFENAFYGFFQVFNLFGGVGVSRPAEMLEQEIPRLYGEVLRLLDLC